MRSIAKFERKERSAGPGVGRQIAGNNPRAMCHAQRNPSRNRCRPAGEIQAPGLVEIPAAQSAEQYRPGGDADRRRAGARGAEEGATGALQTAQTLPFLLASIPAGVLVDRMSRARLMASAETLRVVSLLAVLALMMFGALTLPLLAALGFIGACGTVAYGVAAPALVPSLVERDALPAANGRIELARDHRLRGRPGARWRAGRMRSAAFAGLRGRRRLSAVAVVLLAGLAEPARPRTSPAHPWSDVREGVAFSCSSIGCCGRS